MHIVKIIIATIIAFFTIGALVTLGWIFAKVILFVLALALIVTVAAGVFAGVIYSIFWAFAYLTKLF